MFEGFSAQRIEGAGARIFVRVGGDGAPVLLLHGFPETHLMWRDIAPRLARTFTVVCADLRGYGASDCPPAGPDHAAYAKRTMARDMVEVMRRIGFSRFAVVGHDRGGRVAYRLALDAPQSVFALAVLDVVTAADAWARADARLVTAFWPWSLLAQPAPLPERLILGAPDAVIDDAASQWGSGAAVFAAEARTAYVAMLSDPARVSAICEEYRAAPTLDRADDEADRRNGRRISSPVLALWSATGALERWYAADGGPIGLWRGWADQVEGRAVEGGHFFPEEFPERTAERLLDFIARAAVRPSAA